MPMSLHLPTDNLKLSGRPESRVGIPQSVKSMRTLMGSDCSVRKVAATMGAKSGDVAKVRARALGSSSGTKRATPLRHRFPCRTKTCGSSVTLSAQPDRRPCWDITHAPASSKRAETGTRRRRPDFLPTVSSSVAKVVRTPRRPSSATAGLATYRPTMRSRRNLRTAELATPSGVLAARLFRFAIIGRLSAGVTPDPIKP